MRHLKRNLGFFALAMGAAFAMPATATEWVTTASASTSVTTPDDPGGSSGACGYLGSSTNCEVIITVGTQTLKARAYSSQAAVSGVTNQSQALWRPATMVNYGSGFGLGITNALGTADPNEGNSPEHAVDNNGGYDLIVFELPTSGFDLEAFRLGWASESLTGQTTNGHADIQAWFGGDTVVSGKNFSNVCITGCGSNSLTGAMGFIDITSQLSQLRNGSTVPGGSDVLQDVNVLAPGQADINGAPGKYLVLAGALGGTNDNFKVEMVKASGGFTGTTPLPGTLALLGLGLLGLMYTRRRTATA